MAEAHTLTHHTGKLDVLEQHTAALKRKRLAQENLDRIYASGTAGASEIKAAEREWELADDELDFGPFTPV